MKTKPKRIGIDARFLGPKGKGLGRYAQKLVEYLEDVDGGSLKREYYIFLKKDNFNEYLPKFKNFKKIEADYHWYSFAEQFKFPFFLGQFNLDLMHFCHFNVPLLYRKKFIVTIHDLILFHYPTVRNTTHNRFFYYLKLAAYHWIIWSAARRAAKAIAVSDFTRKDIIDELKIDPNKIEMIHEGCDFRCYVPKQPAEEILKKYGIIKPYIIYVGNAYPHKNLERLVLAHAKAKEKYPELNLVLVGGEEYFYNRLKEFTVNNKVEGIIFPGYVSDRDLDVLYREAKFYIFPSLYEGFGLPPLEALAKSTPVMSSSKTCLPDILGDCAEYFDPEKVNSIAKAIEKGVDEGVKFNEEKVLQNLKKFDWGKMAGEILQIYKENA